MSGNIKFLYRYILKYECKVIEQRDKYTFRLSHPIEGNNYILRISL